MSDLSKASLDGRALAMMSNMYFFRLLNPSHPALVNIGNARVVGVIINESVPPELLLSVDGCQYIETYSIQELDISSVLSVAV